MGGFGDGLLFFREEKQSGARVGQTWKGREGGRGVKIHSFYRYPGTLSLAAISFTRYTSPQDASQQLPSVHLPVKTRALQFAQWFPRAGLVWLAFKMGKRERNLYVDLVIHRQGDKDNARPRIQELYDGISAASNLRRVFQPSAPDHPRQHRIFLAFSLATIATASVALQ